ncbi:MAG: ATP-grasp fold amidoligase family protein [Dehalococcoidia bacterium]|jgi:hypothetical protein
MASKRTAAMIRNIVGKVYRAVIDRLPDYVLINLTYFRTFRRLPNLRHPRTFTEKIAWRKLNQHNPQFPIFADKIAVKAEIARLIGEQHIIETLWVGDNPEDIPFDALKPPYVIKVNHSSGGNVFIRTAQDIKKDKIVASMHGQLGFSHAHRSREWGYLGIPHKVLVERMVEMPGDDVPEDYKFFAYHGCVHFIEVDYDRFKGHKRNLYDREWNLLPVKLKFPPISEAICKPVNLGEMINLAEKIGAQFDFVRVDLYSPPQGILFGEVTFYPYSGLQRFIPKDWDNKFGEPWKI